MSVGTASFAIDPRLKHVSAGWVDEELMTVRRMAHEGASASEIGAAIGKSAAVTRNFIRRNKLVWNKSADRHVLKSAQAIESHMARGACAWHDKALEMRRAGASQKEIADAAGVRPAVVCKLLRKHGLGRIALANDGRATWRAERK